MTRTRPALHFLCAGAALFAATQWWTPVASPRNAAPMTDTDRSDDGLLLREAFALGLDDSRPVRGRLVSLAETLDLAPADDPIRQVREARAVGLEYSDPVVRRHLVELMRLAASTPRTLPDEAALRAYYAAQVDRFRAPERVRLTQVYLSGARRGAAAATDAAALLARLRSGELDAAAGLALGDGFARGAHLGPVSRDELARVLGPAFAEAVFAVPDANWHGPYPSSYGVHLVRVEARLPAAVPDLSRVRSRVLHAYLRERGETRFADTLAALRQ